MLFRERQFMNPFKPGDWVKYKDQQDTTIYKVMDILSNDLIDIEDTIVDKYDIELWQPKPNEWCWFINTNCAPLLAQFVKMQNQSFWINNEYKSVLGYKANKFGHYSGNIGPKDEDYVFVYCEPFIGQLPTHIKDLS